MHFKKNQKLKSLIIIARALKRSRGEAVMCTPKIYLNMLFWELAVSILCSDSSPVLTDLLFLSTWFKTGYQVPVKWLVPTCCRKTTCIWSWYDPHSCFWQCLERKDWEAVAPVCMSGTVVSSEIFLCSSVDKREDGKCAARLIMKGDLCITDMTKGERFLILKCSQVNKRRANCRRK